MPRVSGNLSVMTKRDNVSSKVRDWRDVDVTVIVKKAIMFRPFSQMERT